MLILGGLVLGVVAWLVNRAGVRAVWEAVPGVTQQAVKTSVLCLVWLNVGVVASVRGPGEALAVAALWVPAFVLAKWLYAT
jgi:4-hydroxybenzoate polyprenyltransferase